MADEKPSQPKQRTAKPEAPKPSTSGVRDSKITFLEALTALRRQMGTPDDAPVTQAERKALEEQFRGLDFEKAFTAPGLDLKAAAEAGMSEEELRELVGG